MIRFRIFSLLLFVSALFCPPTGSAQSSQDSKSKLEALLNQSAKEFLAALDDVNEEQWNFRGNGIRHTIGEEAEHVAFAEQELQRIVIRALKAPAQPEQAAALKGKEEKVRELMLDAKKGAENYAARGRLNSKAEVQEYFGMAHTKLLQLLAQSKELDTHIYKHPNKDYGPLTARQWFYYIAYHKMRHTKQIESIKAHPDFPGRVRKASSEPSGAAAGD